jgi:homoserine kinase type II
VLWHVDQEGFHQIALPLETRHHHGYVWHEGHLWELSPWLPGAANYRAQPSPRRLDAAMVALARFHQAAVSFPLPETNPVASPGMCERFARVQELLGGGVAELARALETGGWPEMTVRASRLLHWFEAVAPKLLPTIESATRLQISLQPCIRDVWHAHVLFVGDEVSGIVDFGSMRPDNVATDVARLLGSLAGDDQQAWKRGLDAYHSVRPLNEAELSLVEAFDRSTVLLGGLQWLEWIYLEGRQFDNRADVLVRVDEFLGRLERLAQGVC